MMTFAITMVTYKRKDGSTPTKIKRAIDSLTAQTYQKWKLFLTGDHYDNEEEFREIVNFLPKNKISYYNLPFAEERESGKFIGKSLWCCAGVNAGNHCIKKAKEENYNLIAHLDDDDEWFPNHLEELENAYRQFPEAAFVYTRSKYLGIVLPRENNQKKEYNNLFPREGNIVHSSASWNLQKIDLLYRNTIEQARIYPADADMWERISKLSRQKNLKILYVPLITVGKYDEGSILK